MSLKTIKVNPIFLGSSNGSSFGLKNKTRKEKPAGVSLGQSNSIKKKLIARIKNFQQNSKKQGDETTIETPINDVFGDSMQFLNNLAIDKEAKKQEKKNTTLKKKQTQVPDAYMNIATELPPELDWNTIVPMPTVQMPMPTVQMPTVQMPVQAPVPMPTVQMQVPMPTVQMHVPTVQMHVPTSMPMSTPMPTQIPTAEQWQASPQPSYGNLKKGTKPTYRTWLRTTQKQKPFSTKPQLNILEDVAPIPPENETTSVIPVATTMPYMPSLKPKRKRITRTLKYKLGKHANGKVSVLIKNSQTRRKVQTEQALLKQKSILDIKNHLRSNNLLKAGSNAPSDVLRQMYEQSILAGQVENKAKETLIHNYFNDEKK